MKFPYLIIGITASLASGCTASIPVTPGPRSAPRKLPDSGTISTNSTSWTITRNSQEQRYRAESRSTIEFLSSKDTTRKEITSFVDFALSLAYEPESFVYAATITSVSVHGEIPTKITDDSAALLPFKFTGQLKRGQLLVDSSGRDNPLMTCSSNVPTAITVVQRAIIAMPSVIQKDMTWSDSTQAMTCNGPIPVVRKALQHYKVIGSVPAGILLERQDHITTTGDGTQDQHQITAQTDGLGITKMIIDLQTGLLRESNGTYTTSIVITASGQEQRFRQTTLEKISVR